MAFRPDEGQELHDYEYYELVEYSESIHDRMCASRDKTIKKILRRKYIEISNRLTKLEEFMGIFANCT